MPHGISYEDAQMNNVDPTKCQPYFYWIKYSFEGEVVVSDGFVYAEDADMAINMAKSDVVEEYEIEYEEIISWQTVDMNMFEKAKQELMKKALKV